VRDRDAEAKECVRDDRVRTAIADWLTEWHMLAVYRPTLVKVGDFLVCCRLCMIAYFYSRLGVAVSSGIRSA
jgi:hypothetical protein